MQQRGPMGLGAKTRLAARIAGTFLVVHWRLRRAPLPEVVESLGAGRVVDTTHVAPARLSRIVYGTLHVGRLRPRCLINALILYRLLRAQGDLAELVIGLPHDARDHEAHAWVELDSVDVGPPPGKGRHVELARFG